MEYLKRMMPWIRKFGDRVDVEVEELRRVLGDKAPRPVVEEARRRIGSSPHRAYYIPWDSDEVWRCAEEPHACVFGADVGRALKLIKEAFENKKMRIRWFRVEYIPPGLVKEVIDLVKEKGEREAEEELKGWIDAYFEVIKTLGKVLGVKEDSLEWEELSVVYLGSFVENYASYVIGVLPTALMGAAAVALIAVLTHMAFKREGEGYVREIIELRRSLERLRVEKPGGGFEFNELGRLLVYRVAYVMGMSYDEAYDALKEITGLKTDELETMVEEIKGVLRSLRRRLSCSGRRCRQALSRLMLKSSQKV